MLGRECFKSLPPRLILRDKRIDKIQRLLHITSTICSEQGSEPTKSQSGTDIQTDKERKAGKLSWKDARAIGHRLRLNPTDTVYVFNLPFDATVHDIKEAFGKYNISSIKIGTDDKGRSRGYAHLTLRHLQDVFRACLDSEASKVFIKDRRLMVERSTGSNSFNDLLSLNFTRFSENIPHVEAVISEILPSLTSQIVSSDNAMSRNNAKLGFIHFTSEEAARKAYALVVDHNKSHPGASVNVRHALQSFAHAKLLTEQAIMNTWKSVS